MPSIVRCILPPCSKSQRIFSSATIHTFLVRLPTPHPMASKSLHVAGASNARTSSSVTRSPTLQSSPVAPPSQFLTPFISYVITQYPGASLERYFIRSDILPFSPLETRPAVWPPRPSFRILPRELSIIALMKSAEEYYEDNISRNDRPIIAVKVLAILLFIPAIGIFLARSLYKCVLWSSVSIISVLGPFMPNVSFAPIKKPTYGSPSQIARHWALYLVFVVHTTWQCQHLLMSWSSVPILTSRLILFACRLGRNSWSFPSEHVSQVFQREGGSHSSLPQNIATFSRSCILVSKADVQKKSNILLEGVMDELKAVKKVVCASFLNLRPFITRIPDDSCPFSYIVQSYD